MSLDLQPGNNRQLLALAFADQCRRWARQAGADEAAVRAAGRAGQLVAGAVADGHVCLALDGPDLDFDLEALAASGVAGPPGAGTPLVLDGSRRLYLARHFHGETALARALLERHRHLPPPPGPAALAALRDLFPPLPGGETDWQQVAVGLALGRRLTVISGGPGTGKTTTVARLLACLLADQPDLRIALAAPTGKAAARMLAALAERAAELPPELRTRLPDRAGTLHRLLGLSPAADQPRHHPGNPLPVDLLVVDEASMLDLGLALHLVRALGPDTRLVLLGDKDQLAAVEAGSIFSALSADPTLSPATRARLADWTGHQPAGDGDPLLPAGPLADSVVWLRRSHRFAAGSRLGQLAAALVRGDAQASLKALGEGDADTALLEDGGDSLSPPAEAALAAGYAPYREALAAWVPGQDPAPLFAAFERFRILCALRRGSRGVAGINALIERQFRPPGSSGCYPGQPLLITRNDPITRLYNGDVGLVLPGPQGLEALFPAPDGAWRRLRPAQLPAHETAFAMTVHKAQGSEFERVALVLPGRDTPVLTRELVYTGVTRARRGVQVLAGRLVLLQGIARQVRREGGLDERLLEQGESLPAPPV